MSIELATAINVVMATYRTVKELSEKAENLELRKLILGMNEQLLDVKESALELREENIKLKEGIKKLTAVSEKELVMRDGAYYSGDEDMPYCPNCYNNDKKLIIMTDAGHLYRLWCSRCEYGIK